MTFDNKLTESEISALVVTYLPDNDVIDNISLLSKEFTRILVVDNGSEQVKESCSGIIKSIEQLPNVSVIRLERNKGIASALNSGIKYLKNEGWNWTVTFDQDSVISDNYLLNLCNSYNNFDTKPVIMGSRIINRLAPEVKTRYVKLGKGLSFSLLKPDYDTTEVDIVITSGALTNIDFIVDSGLFMDSYFIDYVDTEMCLRAKSLGLNVALSTGAVIYHELGDKKSLSILGVKFSPTNHSPFRRYYIARNSIDMYKKYGIKFPSWIMYDLIATIYNAIRIVISEKNVFTKFTYSLKGYFHGFKGVSGKLSD